MICQKCNGDFPESQIQTSHDVPCYLFEGKDRKERKNQADKFGRHNLCIKCHDIYERMVFAVMIRSLSIEQRKSLISVSTGFAENYFKKEEKKDDSS